MSLQYIKGDRRTAIYGDLQTWLESADHLYSRFYNRLEDSPFDYHEVAGVGFLGAAAALAGFLPLNEYDVSKRVKNDKRKKVPGRADLWFDCVDRCYSFEFKRTKRPVTIRYLADRLGSAFDDVSCIDKGEHDHAAACLVTVPREEKRVLTCIDFAQEDFVHFAFKIGPVGHEAFLFFQFKD